ncbi:TPA: hypothetical protein ACS72K_003882 [Providencia alcalifaciens]
MANVQHTKQVLEQISNMLKFMQDMQNQITKLRARVEELEKCHNE